MGDPTVVALLLGAAAAAALVARLAFWLGGRRGFALLVAGFALLALLNLTMPAFSDEGRIASGAAIGFVLGTLVGLARYGMPKSRGPGSGHGE
jgi:hypothetical protein